MAWNVTQCKEIDLARPTNSTSCSAIGHHQRHYSTLYAHANEVVQSGILGDIRHIRALWHRNNVKPVLANGRPAMEMYNGKEIPVYRDSWRRAVPAEDAAAIASRVRDFGWKDMNELCRWRLYRRTGGGLMAELGSHQLDACSIFLGKKHPIAVSGVGVRSIYQDERECEDSVYLHLRVPAAPFRSRAHPHYGPDGKTIYNDIAINVTYSSINNNGKLRGLYGKEIASWGPMGR